MCAFAGPERRRLDDDASCVQGSHQSVFMHNLCILNAFTESYRRVLSALNKIRSLECDVEMLARARRGDIALAPDLKRLLEDRTSPGKTNESDLHMTLTKADEILQYVAPVVASQFPKHLGEVGSICDAIILRESSPVASVSDTTGGGAAGSHAVQSSRRLQWED